MFPNGPALQDVEWPLPAWGRVIELARSKDQKAPISARTACEEILSLLPQEIVERHGFDILLMDISLIDDYSFGIGTKSNSVPRRTMKAISHIICPDDDAKYNRIRGYIKALRSLASAAERYGSDPIIVHPKLYDRLYVGLEIDSDPVGVSAPFSSQRKTSVRSFSWTYRLGKASSAIDDQIEKLSRLFLEEWQKAGCPIRPNCYLIVIPIVRPKANRILSGRDVTANDLARNNIDPGGGLFLIVQDSGAGHIEARTSAMVHELRSGLLRSALRESHSEYTLHRRRSEDLEALGHALKAAVQISGWRTALNRTVDALDAQPLNMANFGDRQHFDQLSKSASQAASSLTLFSSVEGLGGLIRLRSILSRGEKSKLLNWFDQKDLERWRNGESDYFLDKYIDLISSFAASVKAVNKQRISIVIEACKPTDSNDGSTAFEVVQRSEIAGDYHNSRAIPQELPPFKVKRDGTSDGSVAFMVAITEPIINAIKANMRESNRQAREQPLKIRLVARLPEYIEFSIENANGIRPNENKSSGVATIEKLLSDCNLASFKDPLIWESDGMYWYRSSVLFHPATLYDKVFGDE